MGINFIDTIVVRQVSERGTSSSESPVKPVDFMGEEKWEGHTKFNCSLRTRNK
ncbi:MAG: hypothetical protein OEM28_00970 [Nitrosopumilus sp.]|nr:hypothetical protein [Nitrosopumilus sp.]MDH3486437.1 hypothetical protein [Nitrosopumilus sp.]